MSHTDTIRSMATRWERVRSEALVRSVAGVGSAGIMLVGIVVGRNTDHFWVTLLAIAGATVVGYFVLDAANKRWP